MSMASSEDKYLSDDSIPATILQSPAKEISVNDMATPHVADDGEYRQYPDRLEDGFHLQYLYSYWIYCSR